MEAVLHVISDRERSRRPQVSESLLAAAKGGADCIQVRDKRATASETYALVMELQKRFAQESLATQVFVNDRIDIAIVTGAEGVHLAAKSLSILAVRKLRLQAEWQGFIGCSVHGLQEALAAQEAGADYVTFGHVFASETHPGLAPRGVHALRSVVLELVIPVLAIGGIDSSNVASVLETGCSGVAVIGAVLDAADPLSATRELKRAMHSSSAILRVPFQVGRANSQENGVII